jgi:hypothetical protein
MPAQKKVHATVFYALALATILTLGCYQIDATTPLNHNVMSVEKSTMLTMPSISTYDRREAIFAARSLSTAPTLRRQPRAARWRRRLKRFLGNRTVRRA